ncbi:hypothetical protein J2794_003547 [Paraburkholderia terricola]|uniref:hypothetical protein n=1 Tax=Paraburkholderia terricola TaxID=169427 RepID=UPI0028662743|nr:hypothetical protein [Paraburkholderia terricola]MDR6447431.1 hypothetical protein [Paraburkholderia terricola]
MEKVVYKYAALVLLGICGLLVYDRIPWNSVEGSTWAGWAQAIGSVAAIAVAMWLATREDRRRSTEAMSLAVATSATLTTRLAIALVQTERQLKRLSSMAKYDAAPGNFETANEQLTAIDIGTIDDVKSLIPLPEDAAYKLAGAQDRLHAVRRMLKMASESREILESSDLRKEFAGQCEVLLGELRDLLDRVYKECERASHSRVSSGWPFNMD